MKTKEVKIEVPKGDNSDWASSLKTSYNTYNQIRKT